MHPAAVVGLQTAVRSSVGQKQGRPVLSIGFTAYCALRILDILRVNNGKYRCKIGLKLQNLILIHGNLAFIADCNLYFGKIYTIYSVYYHNVLDLHLKLLITSLFTLFMTVKIANNTGFNLYGKYRVVIGRNNGPSLTMLRRC